MTKNVILDHLRLLIFTTDTIDIAAVINGTDIN